MLVRCKHYHLSIQANSDDVIPLVIDGRIVGAIGISGGSNAQDGQVAAADAAALK